MVLRQPKSWTVPPSLLEDVNLAHTACVLIELRRAFKFSAPATGHGQLSQVSYVSSLLIYGL